MRSNVSSVSPDVLQEKEHIEQDVLEQLTPSQMTLVEDNLNLVWFVLRRNQSLWANRVEEEEVFQEGTLGLIRAAQKFDQTKGQFSTYAVWWIKNALRDAVRRTQQVTVPQNVWYEIGRLLRIQRNLEKQDAKEPSFEEIADVMCCAPEKVQMLLEIGQRMGQRVLSLEQPSSNGDDQTWLGELIAAPDTGTKEREWLAQKEVLNQLLTYLNAMERRIISLRYRLEGEPLSDQDDGDGSPRPYAAVARVVGKSPEFVQRREAHAFMKLRYGALQLTQEHSRKGKNMSHF